MEVHATGHAEPSHELRSPAYRVHFWEQPAPGYAFNLDAYVLVDASDVEEVQRWVLNNARGRVFELFLEMERQPVREGLERRTVPLVRLAGQNPTEVEHVVVLTD